LAAAEHLGDVEIVSMDSMQVYRGMDIGTAKATRAERARVPHHMVDVADPGEDFSVARFQAEARAAIAGVEARGNRALLVGGTGLYVQAVVDDLRFPGEDLDRRAAIEARLVTPDGLAAGYARLASRDPVAASRIEPGNRRRIARALEVIEITGRPFSSFGAGIGGPHDAVVPVRIAGLGVATVETSVRIEARVVAMAAAGLVDEVRGLTAGPWSRTARQAIGYKEVLAHLDGTVPALADALTETARRTRRFARRQRAWFRRDPRIRWFDVAANCGPPTTEVMAWWGSP
jgi:tRNA dimethylallyltransferase